MHVMPVERDGLVGEQAAHGLDHLAHRAQRLVAVDADLRSERIHHAPSPQMMRPGAVVERERARQAGCALRPDVDHARADFDPVAGRRECRHRHDGVAMSERLSACHTASNLDSA